MNWAIAEAGCLKNLIAYLLYLFINRQKKKTINPDCYQKEIDSEKEAHTAALFHKCLFKSPPRYQDLDKNRHRLPNAKFLKRQWTAFA